MSAAVLAVLAVGTVLLVLSPPTGAARPGPEGSGEAGRVRRRWRPGPGTAALLVGLGVVALVGGSGGALLGVALGAATWVLVPRLQQEQERRRSEDLARQAPLTVDLVAACLASGAPPDVAVEATARAVGSPTCDVLLPAVAALRLGADPEAVWREVARIEGLAVLARAFARSQQSGAALADLLPRVADEVRASARARAEARIRTASVRLTAPLGAALLPAFVLLGVVPVAASWIGVLL